MSMKQWIDMALAKECVSETLRVFLSQISNYLSANESPPILIGDIITSVVQKRLQVYSLI